jgi:hypothetical protein
MIWMVAGLVSGASKRRVIVVRLSVGLGWWGRGWGGFVPCEFFPSAKVVAVAGHGAEAVFGADDGVGAEAFEADGVGVVLQVVPEEFGYGGAVGGGEGGGLFRANAL